MIYTAAFESQLIFLKDVGLVTDKEDIAMLFFPCRPLTDGLIYLP